MSAADPRRAVLGEWFRLARPFSLTACGGAGVLRDGAGAHRRRVRLGPVSRDAPRQPPHPGRDQHVQRVLRRAARARHRDRGRDRRIYRRRTRARQGRLCSGRCSATSSRSFSASTWSWWAAGRCSSSGASRRSAATSTRRVRGRSRTRRSARSRCFCLWASSSSSSPTPCRIPGSFPTYVPLAALPIGGPVAAILLANNIRDMRSDRRGGRRTLPIVFGREVAILIYRALLLEAYVAVAALMAFGVVPLECAVVFLSATPAIRLWRDIALIDDARASRPGGQAHRRTPPRVRPALHRRGAAGVADLGHPFRASYLAEQLAAGEDLRRAVRRD